MKIENWERQDVNKHKIIWKHDTGVTIMLNPADRYAYKLVLYDKQGREHFRIFNPNKTKLEQESVKWQRDYNRYLKKNKKPKEEPVYMNGRME